MTLKIKTLRDEYFVGKINESIYNFDIEVYNACFNMVTSLLEPGLLNFNVAISVDHLAFHKIRNYMHCIETLERESFGSADELVEIINKLGNN